MIGLRKGVTTYAAMNAVMLPNRTVFIADTYVNADPTAEQLAEITLLAAEEMRRFGITPKVALLSHSIFGTQRPCRRRKKMQRALALISAADPDLEVDGEMHGDAALSEEVRKRSFPNSRLKGEANLLIMPTLDAANISFNLLKVGGGRRRDARPDPARRRQAGAHPHAVGDRAAHRQHDRADRRRLLRPAPVAVLNRRSIVRSGTRIAGWSCWRALSGEAVPPWCNRTVRRTNQVQGRP